MILLDLDKKNIKKEYKSSLKTSFIANKFKTNCRAVGNKGKIPARRGSENCDSIDVLGIDNYKKKAKTCARFLCISPSLSCTR